MRVLRRLVNETLKEELKLMHAFSQVRSQLLFVQAVGSFPMLQKSYTPEQWAAKQAESGSQ